MKILSYTNHLSDSETEIVFAFVIHSHFLSFSPFTQSLGSIISISLFLPQDPFIDFLLLQYELN